MIQYHHCPGPEPDECSSHSNTLFSINFMSLKSFPVRHLKIHFNVILRLGLPDGHFCQVFQLKFCVTFSFTCMLHAPPISFLIVSSNKISLRSQILIMQSSPACHVLGPNVLPNILFSHNLNRCSSLWGGGEGGTKFHTRTCI
jgi:hypothetical protein